MKITKVDTIQGCIEYHCDNCHMEGRLYMLLFGRNVIKPEEIYCENCGLNEAGEKKNDTERD